MIQTLQFESAWNKTIAPQDREEIIEFFHSCVPHLDAGVHFSFLREAINHQGDILVTVLIHNVNNYILTLNNTVMTYESNQQIIATDMFSLPCDVKENTSMPWTFIFSQDKQITTPTDYVVAHHSTHHS